MSGSVPGSDGGQLLTTKHAGNVPYVGGFV